MLRKRTLEELLEGGGAGVGDVQLQLVRPHLEEYRRVLNAAVRPLARQDLPHHHTVTGQEHHPASYLPHHHTVAG